MITPSMKTSHYKYLSSPLSCFFVSFCRSMENLKPEYLPNDAASNSDVFCRLCKSYFRTLTKINRWEWFSSRFVWIKNALAMVIYWLEILPGLGKVNFIINFLFSSEKKAQQKGSRKHKAHKNENRSARTLLTRATSEPVWVVFWLTISWNCFQILKHR